MYIHTLCTMYIVSCVVLLIVLLQLIQKGVKTTDPDKLFDTAFKIKLSSKKLKK